MNPFKITAFLFAIAGLTSAIMAARYWLHASREYPSELAREEVFGPVLAAMPFDGEADAIRLANSTDFGLVAGV